MKHPSVQRLLNWGRGLLLTTTILALGTAAVWAWRPGWVAELDDYLLARHLEPVEAALEAARGQAPGAPETLAALEALLDRLDGVSWNDRLGPPRVEVMDALVSGYEASDQADQALAMLERLVEFSPKHLPARLDLARHLYLREDRRVQALEELATLFELMPEDARVAEAYVDMLMSEDLPARALEVALDHDRRARSSLWRIYWKSNPSGNERQALVTPRIGADGRLRLETTIEGPVRSLRAVLPERQAMTFVDPVLRAVFDDKSDELSLLGERANLVGMSVNGNELTTNGRTNAFFEVELKSKPKAATTELSLEADFRFERSSVLSRLASRPRMASVIADADVGLDPILARELGLAGLRASAAGSLEVFWSSAGQAFSGERRAAVGLALLDHPDPDWLGFAFEASVPVGQPADSLRLDLPDARGVRWRLEQLELILASGPLSLDPAAVALTASHSVEREGQLLVVTGKDPWVAFAVPGGSASAEPSVVREVRVRGEVSK